ncbi:MAG: hypothetical protein FD180_4197 [Planctomycetota bacterium]|nr:MAG: hypothetical protein FD180_4197 [Planctomycetota bacterium]
MAPTSCSKCGAEVSAETRFCPACGTAAVPSLPVPPAPADPGRSGGEQVYNLLADKVGFVPNVRGKDNVIQGISVAAALLIGAGIGFFLHGGFGAIVGGVTGMVAGLLISGAVLAIVGLVRKL